MENALMQQPSHMLGFTKYEFLNFLLVYFLIFFILYAFWLNFRGLQAAKCMQNAKIYLRTL